MFAESEFAAAKLLKIVLEGPFGEEVMLAKKLLQVIQIVQTKVNNLFKKEYRMLLTSANGLFLTIKWS